MGVPLQMMPQTGLVAQTLAAGQRAPIVGARTAPPGTPGPTDTRDQIAGTLPPRRQAGRKPTLVTGNPMDDGKTLLTA